MFSTEFFFLFNLFQFIAKKKTNKKNKKRKEKILSSIRNGRWIIYLHFVYKYYGKTLTFFRLLAESIVDLEQNEICRDLLTFSRLA